MYWRKASSHLRSTTAKGVLEPVHFNMCGKMNENLLIFEYFFTFIDDKSHCAWVYPLKTKDQVFDCFLEWKALGEKSSGKKSKTFHTDSRKEYTSKTFETYLKSKGIWHA